MYNQFLLTLQLLVLQLPAMKGQGLLWYVLVFFDYSFTIDKQYISVQYSSYQCRTMKFNNSQQWPSADPIVSLVPADAVAASNQQLQLSVETHLLTM